MLRINKLFIEIECIDDSGNTKVVSPYMKYSSGVNLIWDKGKNSVGKSTCINSIIYALGMEELLGAKNTGTMKPVLTKSVKVNGKQYNVLETYIYLEIFNGKKVITIRRSVKGNEYDAKLVRVYNCELSRCNNKEPDYTDYYLHDKGSAQSDFGFHYFLENYLDLRLPDVSYNDGSQRKLYMQTIFNMFFIEQVRGWTGFNVQKVYYGIKNIEKTVIEYILGCKISDAENAKKNLTERLVSKKQEWKNINNNLNEKLMDIGIEIKGVPKKHTDFQFEDIDKILIDGESIIDKKKKLIKELDVIENLEGNAIKNNLDFIKNNLKVYQEELQKEEKRLEDLNLDIATRKSYKETLEEQLDETVLKIRRYKDIQKLIQLGSDKKLSFLNNRCPICNNEVNDNLLPSDINIDVMSVEENTYFNEGEKRIIETAIYDCKVSIDFLDKKIKKSEVIVEELRNKIRTCKRDLVKIDELPSEEIIIKKYELLESIKTISKIESYIEKNWFEFKQLKENILKIENEISNLSKQGLSDLDSAKIEKFQGLFRKLLNYYGYSSNNIYKIILSEDKYIPISEGFHLMFDSAGSDFIRAIWAYLVALYIASRDSGNHIGCFILDEPFQQQVSDFSIERLIDSLIKSNCQCIIATSISEEQMKKIKEKNVNILTIEENFIELEKSSR